VVCTSEVILGKVIIKLPRPCWENGAIEGVSGKRVKVRLYYFGGNGLKFGII